MATFQRQTIQPVATCRQTVEASLATPHRLAADGYVSAPNNSARSHLSPDGGSLPRHAPPLGSGWLRFSAKQFSP
jgi:hypothetical protein